MALLSMLHFLVRMTPKPVIRTLSRFHGTPGRVRKRMASVLWRALVRLDPPLVHNLGGTAPSTPQFTPEPVRAGLIGDLAPAKIPTLIYNANSLVPNTTALRLLVSSVFETSQLTPSQERLFARLCEQPQLWGDREALVAAMRASLMEQLQRAPGDDMETLTDLRQLSIHQAKTRESLEAYAPGSSKPLNRIFWPNPDHKIYPTSLFEELPFVHTIPLLERTTPIGSAGSCFAMEIAHRLQRDGYNYVITEPHHLSGMEHFTPACSRWGAIYKTPSFRQLVEKAFGLRSLPKLLWSRDSGGKTIYLDPFREEVVFDSITEFEDTYESHRRAARDAFLQAQLFVFTLGMNEVWRLKADGSVLSRAPWRISPDLVEKKVLTVEENLRELEDMLAVLRRYNPDVKLIVSVSPVPLHATFRGEDTHVITANCYSKSTLRVVAEKFTTRNRGVYYFPSYEVVTYCTEKPWDTDQRHVSRIAVDRVMQLFYRMFSVDGSSPVHDETAKR